MQWLARRGGAFWIRCRVWRDAAGVAVLVAVGGRWFGFLVGVVGSWWAGCVRSVERSSAFGVCKGA
jgi:hypothetical protein